MAVGIGGVNRTPGQKPRTRRNFDKLGDPTTLIDESNAIQLSSGGKIILVIATDEPFTQTSAGLVLSINETMTKASGVLGVDLDRDYERSMYYG